MTDPKPSSDRAEQQEQEKWYERTRYQVLLFVGGILVFGLVLGLILDWYIDPQTSTQKKDLIQALGLITAGVAGAIGIYFTWRGQRITQRAQEENQRHTQAQLENAREELHLTRHGQITDRFTRAIDQLGRERLELQLGGIYSLEQIARESEEYHWPIMEILTSYVRENASRASAEEESKQNQMIEGEDGQILAIVTPPLPPDIVAILTVLRRRDRQYGIGEPNDLDLSYTDLRGASLSNANLQAANLSGADLLNADLSGADLSGAKLLGANLQSANLIGTDFTEADLEAAFIKGAHLARAKLDYANLNMVISLTYEQLENTSGNQYTELSRGIPRPKAWCKEPDDQTDEINRPTPQ